VTPLVTRFMFIVISLMTTTILLVRAQPYDDHAVSGLLITKDCDAPCFMGIQPGITTAGEAVKLLESHEWVTNIEARYTDFGQSTNTFWGYVYWQWKPDSPLWTHIPSNRLGLHDAFLRILDGHVNEIDFSTSLPLGAAVLSLGHNDIYTLKRPIQYGSPPYHIAQNFYYPDTGLVIGSVSLCPALNPDWHQDTIISVWSPDYFDSFMQVTHALESQLKDERGYARMGCK